MFSRIIKIVLCVGALSLWVSLLHAADINILGDVPVVTRSLQSLVFGSTTVTTAGTRVILLTAGTKTDTLTIKAKAGNNPAFRIFVGDVTVTSSNGFELKPGESVSLDIDHAEDPIYIDASFSGDAVTFIGGTI